MAEGLVVQGLVWCPLCEKYNLDESRPSLSRFDGQTMICEMCGSKEAHVVMYCKRGTSDKGWTWEQWRKYVYRQIASIKQHNKRTRI